MTITFKSINFREMRLPANIKVKDIIRVALSLPEKDCVKVMKFDGQFRIAGKEYYTQIFQSPTYKGLVDEIYKAFMSNPKSYKNTFEDITFMPPLFEFANGKDLKLYYFADDEKGSRKFRYEPDRNMFLSDIAIILF